MSNLYLLFKKNSYYIVMRKIIALLYIFLLLTSNLAFADEDLWDNYGDTNAYGRKPVTDEEFDKALESKTRKKRNKNIPKGNEMYQSDETKFMQETIDELPVLCLPVNIYLSKDEILPVGHYQIEGYQKDGKYFLKFYQAHYKIAEIPVAETQDDFEQDSVHFVKLLEQGDKQVKIIFGSLDFNAYTILDIAE